MVNNDLAKTNPTEYLHELFAKYHLKDPLLHSSQDPLGTLELLGFLAVPTPCILGKQGVLKTL